MFIEIPVILARVKFSVFHLYKEEGGDLRGLGFLNLARFEVFVNEFLTCVHFLWVQGICFGHFQNEGVLQIYSMVKQLSRREFP